VAHRHLSKSKIMAGRQCEKRLWLEVHRPELLEYGPGVEQRFAVGHAVNEIVQSQYPEGILVSGEESLSAALRETKRLLQVEPGRPLFEATFRAQNVLVRVDLLEKRHGGHDFTEVKSSTSVKESYYDDCAVQAWVLEKAGMTLSGVYLCHINNGFVYAGDGDYSDLFHYEPLTAEITPLKREVPKWVRRYKRLLDDAEPCIDMGPQCTDPYECPFIEYCRGEESGYPLRYLPGRQAIVAELAAEGIDDIRAVPEGRLTNAKQEWVRRVTAAGEAELRPGAAEVARYGYPRYYLDFETIAFAVPIWAGTSPYKQLPFQWSCHIEAADGTLRHEEFLDTSGEPPMRTCAESLIRTLKKRGPIFVYGSFEKMILNALADRFPDLAEDLVKITGRLVDLLPVVRENYYHPDMQGSWSIKKVLPTVAPHLDYATLGEVQDGGAAQTAYLRIIDPDTDAQIRKRLIADLQEYCSHDTLAMVELVRFLATAGKGDNPGE